MSILITALLVMAGAWADRIRGTGNVYKLFGVRNGELPGAIVVAGILWFLFGISPWGILAFMVAWKAGESLGWSEIVGAPCRGNFDMHEDKLEAWMVGPLRKSWLLAALTRGFIWGIPMAIASYFFIPHMVEVMLIAYTIAFPLSSIIAMRLTSGGAVWGYTEYIRGGLVILFLILGLH